MSLICIVILVAWSVISVFAQFDLHAMRKLKARDVFSLIPNWHFFAPHPRVYDYHLLFRDLQATGEPGPWQVASVSGQRTLWAAVWNPQKRGKQILTHIVQFLLLGLRPKKTSTSMTLNPAYLLILNYISSLPREASSVQTEFMILRSDGFVPKGEPRLVFRSVVHRL